MPIYEYDCRSCGHRLEVLIRTEGDRPKRCPSCGAAGLVKAFSAFAVTTASPAAPCERCPSSAPSCSSGACAGSQCPFSR